jgi:hypothetical protein
MIRSGRLLVVVALSSVLAAAAAPAGESVAVPAPSAADSTASPQVSPGMTDSVQGPVHPDSAGAAVVAKRALPPRTLSLRHQVMFAGGFMAFVALMMTSMQNFNP